MKRVKDVYLKEQKMIEMNKVIAKTVIRCDKSWKNGKDWRNYIKLKDVPIDRFRVQSAT